MKHEDVSPVEMLRARITYTETGFPATLSAVADCYGNRVNPAPQEGWFWIGASERSAADIRRRGHKVVGSLVTTYIPADDGRPEEEVPVWGSAVWGEMMLRETRAVDGPRADGGYIYADAPEFEGTAGSGRKPHGPLRKVIIFRLKRVADEDLYSELVAAGPDEPPEHEAR